LVLAVALVMVSATTAVAQYPSKPIRFVMPFPAGGPTDVLGRVIAQKLSEQVGQPVVVENRPGAGGNLGFEIVAQAAPDGYTIVMGAPPLAITPHLLKLNYEPMRDFAPIAEVASMPTIVIVHPSLPVKTLKDLVELAKSKPGKLNFGSGGAGTSNHLASELLNSIAKIRIVHVPYKGASQAMISLIAGEIDMVVIGVPTAVPQIKAGKVRALAVLSDKRLPSIPDVPTAAEAGFPGYEVATWYGLLAPAGTPKEIVDRLNRELKKVMEAPAVKEKLISLGFDTMASTPEQFSDFIKTETVRWGKVIKDAGIKVQ